MIAVEQLSLRQGSFALDDISFTVPTNRYAVLMGRTASGKTTILESICGLRPLRRGRILLCDRDVTGEKPGARNLGYVPQDGALFTSMSVRDNIRFALDVRRWPAAAAADRVAELADLLGITTLLDQGTHRLSGGEAQRVALGRALAARPPVLLLDEPLSALDDDTRAGMCALLESVRARTGVTVLHVTHNAQDAERLADLALRMEDGRVMVCEQPRG